jgi:GNAT superfamily N-acetyltransferase
MRAKNSKLEFHPLTPQLWADFETLFGERGACGGCWCMWWRIARSQYETQKGAGNKQAMKKLVDGGHTPGILAYQNGQPIGWCSVAPRESFSRLERSRGLKPVDEQPVWSVVCFFVAKEHRRNGLSVKLLKAAVDFVRGQGGRIVEGYPVDPKKKQADAFVWSGLASAFVKAGFKEVERRSETRPIMRYEIKQKSNFKA